MSLHIVQKRCEDCGRINAWRKPNRALILARALPLLQCPYCHPESLKDVCAACRLPFRVMPSQKGRGKVRKGMCFSCYASFLRWLKRVALQTGQLS